MKLYLNSAKCLKVGSNLWVDRTFSGAVLNANYSFHASTSAFVEFWNTSFWMTQYSTSVKISHCQIWQAFVQESLRRVALPMDFNLELPDRLPIEEVTGQAFNVLGEDGLIRSADGHTCSECTHEYRRVADVIVQDDDAAALVGVDENHHIPVYIGEDDPQMIMEHVGDEAVDDPMEVDEAGDDDEAVHSPVQMVILDGIVMGHNHCAFEDCTESLANNRHGVFCLLHETERGHLCHIHGCARPKAAGIKTCQEHREQWFSHVTRFGRSTLLGIHRMLRRAQQEILPWLPAHAHQVQPHDEPEGERRQGNYFTPSRFYCVETICAPCGVVIAWAKFAKAESPTNILNFLDRVYPDANTRPDYVCIDKACLVLRHAIVSGRWNIWKTTTRFIVDSYHYINHRATDYLCRKYCNPAPLNGSAPNLVMVEYDRNGEPHYKRAFNTQVHRFLFNTECSNIGVGM
jgi:hypothetical protein